MDESQEPERARPDSSGLVLGEPVLAAAPSTGARRHRRPGVLAPPTTEPSTALPPPTPPVAPAPAALPTPAEYFAAKERRAATAHERFDPARAVKGPTVVVAKRQRGRGRVVLALAAIAAGAAVGAVTFLGGGDGRSEATERAADVTVAPVDRPRADSLEEVVDTIGELEVRMGRVTDPFGSWLGPAPDGFRFVAVDLVWNHGGDGLVELDRTEALALVDGQGRRWSLADVPIDGLDPAVLELGPGMQASTASVFVVGDDASELSLVVRVPGAEGEIRLPLP